MWNEGYYPHMMGFGDGGWLLPMGVHGLFSLLLIGLLVYGVVVLIRHFSPKQSNDAAVSALGKRYAAGEIGRDEYLAKKKDIQN